MPDNGVRESEPLVISAEGESAQYLKSKLDRRWQEVVQRIDDDEMRG